MKINLILNSFYNVVLSDKKCIHIYLGFKIQPENQSASPPYPRIRLPPRGNRGQYRTFYAVTWCVSRDAPCCACVELSTTEKWTSKAQLQGRWVTVCLAVDTRRLCRGGNVSDAGIAADVSTLTPVSRNETANVGASHTWTISKTAPTSYFRYSTCRHGAATVNVIVCRRKVTGGRSISARDAANDDDGDVRATSLPPEVVVAVVGGRQMHKRMSTPRSAHDAYSPYGVTRS